MYRQILIYNFSDSNTRRSFQELIEEVGFIPVEDQSTYVLELFSELSSQTVRNIITRWSASREVNIGENDLVQIFYATTYGAEGRRVPTMGSRILRYDSNTTALV